MARGWLMMRYADDGCKMANVCQWEVQPLTMIPTCNLQPIYDTTGHCLLISMLHRWTMIAVETDDFSNSVMIVNGGQQVVDKGGE